MTTMVLIEIYDGFTRWPGIHMALKSEVPWIFATELVAGYN